MRSHTPGPWVASKRRPGDWDIETNDADIAEVHGFGYSDEGESDANARLIAAAPELLEACKRWEAMIPLLRMLTVHQVLSAGDAAIGAAGLNPYCINEGLAAGDEPAIAGWKFESIRAAIAKATGATP